MSLFGKPRMLLAQSSGLDAPPVPLWGSRS
jgi:hypothetical protein